MMLGFSVSGLQGFSNTDHNCPLPFLSAVYVFLLLSPSGWWGCHLASCGTVRGVREGVRAAGWSRRSETHVSDTPGRIFAIAGRMSLKARDGFPHIKFYGITCTCNCVAS